jgi:CubicO group peptidase (beta-lactamase class C family)
LISHRRSGFALLNRFEWAGCMLDRLDARTRVAEIAASADLRAVDITAGNAEGQTFVWDWSGEGFRSAAPTGSARRYLIASLTKPIVATLAVQLAADGHLVLNEPVREQVAGFHRGPLRTITPRHLLTHTSGLPDMLADNIALRRQQSPLSEFVRRTAECVPDFPAGTACQYSSMGFAVLAAMIENRLQQPLSQVLRDRLVRPMGMRDTWLGLPEEQASELLPTVLPCELPDWQSDAAEWNWNSRYWRTLGAAWGGMISTASDLGRIATLILNDGRHQDGRRVLSAAVVEAVCRNQSRPQSRLPGVDRHNRPWGFGWRFNWPDHSTCFSDFLPASAIGHWGATGTLMWLDRRSQRWCVILTTQPYERSQPAIQRMSNVIAADDSLFQPNTN